MLNPMIYKNTAKAIKSKVLDFYGTTPYRLNRDKTVGLSMTAIDNLLAGKQRMSIKTAVKFELAFPENGMKAIDWIMLDIDQEIRDLKKDKKLVSSINPLKRED